MLREMWVEVEVLWVTISQPSESNSGPVEIGRDSKDS